MSDLVGNPKDRFSHNEAHIEGTVNHFFCEKDKFVKNNGRYFVREDILYNVFT